MDMTMNELASEIIKKDESLLSVLSKNDKILISEGLIEIVRPSKIIDRQVKFRVNDIDSLIDSLVELADR